MTRCSTRRAERRPPFPPEDVVAEFAPLLKSYHHPDHRRPLRWRVAARFREQGISYEPAQTPKSDLYRDLLPINLRKLDLLDDACLLTELVGLERRTARGSRDSIDHVHERARRHCVAGLAAAASRGAYDASLDWVSAPAADDAEDDFQRQGLSQHILQTGGYYRLWR
jgi:hypothetical protein